MTDYHLHYGRVGEGVNGKEGKKKKRKKRQPGEIGSRTGAQWLIQCTFCALAESRVPETTIFS